MKVPVKIVSCHLAFLWWGVGLLVILAGCSAGTMSDGTSLNVSSSDAGHLAGPGTSGIGDLGLNPDTLASGFQDALEPGQGTTSSDGDTELDAGEGGTAPDARVGGSPPPTGEFTCTIVIGYSQVTQWFRTGGAFESIVNDDEWQLLARSGANIRLWAQSDFDGWTQTVGSPCANGSASPDRALLSVSGTQGSNEDGWANRIEQAIDTLRQKYPSVKQIILEPVVGGPSHEDCMNDGKVVRASWQHKHIDGAIAQVVAADEQVFAGLSPEVRTCADYRDGLGHLTDEGATAVGQAMGEYYK